jgi:hypothetical protein
LFPFQRLTHSFVVAGGGRKFDPTREKKSVENLRKGIEFCKRRVMQFVDQTNSSAVAKAKHYISALDAQLAICDRTDEAIDRLSGRRRSSPDGGS